MKQMVFAAFLLFKKFCYSLKVPNRMFLASRDFLPYFLNPRDMKPRQASYKTDNLFCLMHALKS